MVLMYNDFEDLQIMATTADNPFSDMQLVNLGIKILRKVSK